MSAWFWVALGLLPFAVVGLWFTGFVLRNFKAVMTIWKGDA